MTNIEKIRQEIERRRDFFYERYLQKGIGCIEETRYDECVEILSFIDSLPDCTVKTNGQGRVKDDVYDSMQEQKPADLSEMTVHKEPYIAPVPTPELQKFIDMELFRMEAAKDILCVMLPSVLGKGINPEDTINAAINLANGLISKLKDNE